jgi:hypothetical protein
MLNGAVILLKGWKPNLGASKDVVQEVQSELGIVFPTDNVELMEWSNGGVGWIGQSYLYLLPIEELALENESLGAAKYAPGVVFFGGDGGGMKYGFDTNYDPPAIVEVDAVSIGIPEDTTMHRMSFADFLRLLHKRRYEQTSVSWEA